MTIINKVVTVANDDTSMNTEIATQNADGFAVFSLTLSGTDVIILFQKIDTSLA